MDALSANSGMSAPEMYAMKQAIKVDERAMSKILESAQSSLEATLPKSSGLTQEGIGQNLDLMA